MASGKMSSLLLDHSRQLETDREKDIERMREFGYQHTERFNIAGWFSCARKPRHTTFHFCSVLS